MGVGRLTKCATFSWDITCVIEYSSEWLFGGVSKICFFCRALHYADDP